MKRIGFFAALAGVLLVTALISGAWAEQVTKVAVCHKFGTPAQKTLYLPYQGAMGHVNGHGDLLCACPENDYWIDADGIATPGRGLPAAIDPGFCGASLLRWPTGSYSEGIDWFDNDGNCAWSSGDDLHVEGAFHPGALRDGFHDFNTSYSDPVVLDLDGSFFDRQQVDVDLETGTIFTGCMGPDPLMTFFDANGNGFWDNGEDIIYDANNDGIVN